MKDFSAKLTQQHSDIYFKFVKRTQICYAARLTIGKIVYWVYSEPSNHPLLPGVQEQWQTSPNKRRVSNIVLLSRRIETCTS